jgi:hypothetical protein
LGSNPIFELLPRKLKCMSDLRYERVDPLSRDELDARLASEEPEVVADALYRAARWQEDSLWVQRLCVDGLRSPHIAVRWAAATSLGDLACWRRPLDIAVVIAALERAVDDPAISDPATFSLSMVRQFSSFDDPTASTQH